MQNLKYSEGFKPGVWCENIDVVDFIRNNYTLYTGDDSFLVGATERTKKILARVENLFREEQSNSNGILSIDTETVAGITAYKDGYIDKDMELIVGLQTTKPLERGVYPFGGMRMVRTACAENNVMLSSKIEDAFKYRTTHNDAVFKLYTPEMKAARHVGLLTGLPDAYGRGRLIGDYRRVALYGVDTLIAIKEQDKTDLDLVYKSEDILRKSEELSYQISALKQLKEMARTYGFDISRPAETAKEAIQWLYFAYLGSIKETNGAANSLGRVSTFLDIYIERDIQNGLITEEQAQELMDDFVLKLRMIRHLRVEEYNELYGGDPVWITESVGGLTENGKPLVTKNSFRMLHTLYNLNTSPEPNITILWSERLPQHFKRYCAKVSIETSALQYENDDIMRVDYGDDYGISCCVSSMKLGKEMQFFGARTNLPKLLLLALNGGTVVETGTQLGPQLDVYNKEVLDYEEILNRLDLYRPWLANLYVNTMNTIHYSHDKYAYENLQMALHDTEIHRNMAFGIAGLSVLADSLSAIKYGQVKPIKNENGLIVDFEVVGEFPKYGNDDDRVDDIIVEQVKLFYEELCKTPTYRGATPTLSVLTITSNVVYGKKTGNTPDGRRAGESFAPGANPMHNREKEGALASLNSVAKIPYEYCRDGVSNTFTLVPTTLGKSLEERVHTLVFILDGYVKKQGHHLNVNVLNRELLEKAFEQPELYPNLTIRVSGYAVNFTKLSKEQQIEVIHRTFHEEL